MNIWDFLEQNENKEEKDSSLGSIGVLDKEKKPEEKSEDKPEENPFDLLNTDIEKNYKQYQSTTKKLEAYKDEYAIAPEMFKPTLMANYNKLVDQNNELVKQLQIDIGKRDQIINTANQRSFKDYKQFNEPLGEPTSKVGAEAGVTLPKPEQEPLSQAGVTQRMRGIGQTPTEYDFKSITTDYLKTNKSAWEMWFEELKSSPDKLKFLSDKES